MSVSTDLSACFIQIIFRDSYIATFVVGHCIHELDHTSRGTASFLNYRLTFHIVLRIFHTIISFY
jgi:hypothetical protein